MGKYTYEESVRWMRSQPEHAALVKLCYLDKDNLIAAKRFTMSEEFAAVDAFLSLSKSRKELKILDLGCGNGIASYAFASLGHDVSAIDPDGSGDVGLAATARLASSVDAGSISTFCSFAESLPFPDATFDIVYARQALHHFQDLRKGVAECSRVLRPGGTFFATREHVVTDEEQLRIFLAEHLLHALHGGEHAYTLAEYLSSLESVGFRLLGCLGPYDTVINHFPESNSEVKRRIHHSLMQRYGRVAASILLKIKPAEQRYRRRMSAGDDSPGRLYSFFCVNDGTH